MISLSDKEEVDLTAEAEGSAPDLTVYSDKATVKQVQQALNDAGFNCGTPDGIAGKNTANAIQSYQQAHGLTVTGTITGELLDAMGLR